MKEQKVFQTQTKELLNLMINSIYSNKDIFLRELISNASDAIDKYKYFQLTDSTKYPVKNDFQITLKTNPDLRTLTIIDNGIGMTKDEVINNLGTIAKSGSKEFIENLKKAQSDEKSEIIGQFGVGFYASFMVAKKVEVRTRSLSDTTGYLFTSDGVDSYSIEEIEKNDTGTEITLYLKDDVDEEDYTKYLSDYEIEDLVKKYSDYIRYPIVLEIVKKEQVKNDKGEPVEGEFSTTTENKTLNSMVPLWKKPRKDVSDEDLNNFYKNQFTDYENPFASLYIKAEGMMEYDALVFIPNHAPYNLYSDSYEKGLDLYVKDVFIKSHTKELVPEYLKFIKGVVNSNDLPLNISREMLQNAPVLKKIQTNIEKKVLDKLADIKKEDIEKYIKFFDVFGNNLKYGIYSSYGQKAESIQDLLIFHHMKADDRIDLAKYLEENKDSKYIYYASGTSLEAIKLLPQLEKYRKDNIDVLFFKDEIDEFTFMMMKKYKDKEFKSITEVDENEVSAEDKEKLNDLNAKYKRILDEIKESLKDKVDDVSFSTKLVDSPVCIENQKGISLNMEHVLNENPNLEEKVKAQKVLQINPDHALFTAISNLTSDEDIQKYGKLLYEEALILQGFDISDKQEFVKNLNELMIKSIK